MRGFNKNYIKKLKEKIVERFNGSEINSSDCYPLSVEIQQQVNCRVSETTLKRFLGFTSANHNPSQYTLNALAMYCGYNSWAHFKETEDQLIAENSQNKSWLELKSHLTKITHFHINAYQRRNAHGRSFKVRREWIHDCMARFEGSPQNVFIFHGPAGWGKTSAITAWIEEQFEIGEENIYLYLDGLSFLQSAVYGYNPVKWLANVFDFSSISQVNKFFQNYAGGAPGNLHVIIDGFNEAHLTETQYYAVFGNLLDMIDHFSTFSWLKFTLILRTNIYQKAKRHLPKNYSEGWFNEKSSDNSPAFRELLKFSTIELSTLFEHHGIAHGVNELCLAPAYEWLRVPKYFETFLHLRRSYAYHDFRTDELPFFLIRDLLERDLTLLNALSKVDRTELVALLEGLSCVDQSRPYTKEVPFGQKRKSVVLQHSGLFDKLVGRGMLVAERETPLTQYQFRSPFLKAFFYAHFQYHTAGMKDIEQLITQARPIFENSPEAVRLSFIWFVFFKLEDLDFSFVKLLENYSNPVLPPINDFLYYAICFANHLFHSGGMAFRKELSLAVVQSDISVKTLHLTNLPYEKVKHAFHLMTDFHREAAEEFRLRLKMALLSFLKWDEPEFIEQLEHLTRLQTAVEGKLSLHPTSALSTLYHFFKFGKIDIQEVRASFNDQFEIEDTAEAESDYVCDILGYLLLMVTKDRSLAEKYHHTVLAKLNAEKRPSSTRFIIYKLLSQLSFRLSGNQDGPTSRSQVAADRCQQPHASREVARNSLLGIFIQILELHRDIAESDSIQMFQARIAALKSIVEPMGYAVLSTYFASIATPADRPKNCSPISANDIKSIGDTVSN